MATTAKLEISVTQRGITTAQRSLDRLKASAQKASATMKKFGTTAKKAADSSLTRLEGSVKKFSGFLNGEGSSSISKMSGRIGKLVKSFGGMKAAIIAVIALQLARWLKVAVDAAIEFNTAIANIGTLIPEQITKTREYSASIQELSISYGKSQKDMADATYQTISAFGDLDNTFEIVDLAAQASTAGLASTADAVNLLSAVSKGYNDTSTETIQKISDLAFTTVRLGQTTFPELAASIGTVVPLASSLGVEMEELFAVASTLTGVTGTTSEVMTQFRSILTATVKPTAQLSALYEKLGVSSGKAFIESQGGIAGALQAIQTDAKATGQEMAAYLGRVEGLTGALALTGAQSDIYIQKLEEQRNASGATAKALLEQTEGVNRFGFNLKQLQTNLDTLKTSIGEAFLPLVSNAAPSITVIIDLLKGVFTALTGIIRQAEAITRPLRAAMLAPAKAIVGLVNLLLKGLGGAFTFVSDIVNSLITLFKTEFLTTFNQIKDIIVDFVDFGLFDFVDGLDASQIAISIFTTVMQVLGPVLLGVVGYVKTLTIVFKSLFAIMTTSVQNVKNVFTLNFKGIIEDGKKLATALTGNFKEIKDTAVQAGSDIKTSMNSDLEDVAKKAKSVSQRINAYRMGQVDADVFITDTESYKTIIAQFKEQINQIERNRKSFALLGQSYDTAGERSKAYESSLKKLLSTADIAPSSIAAFVKANQGLLRSNAKGKKGYAELRKEFKKGIGDIDQLAKVYKSLGIEYNAVDEKSKSFNKTLKELVENGAISAEQVEAFATEFGKLNKELENTQSLFEKTKEKAKDFTDVLSEGIFNALEKIKGVSPEVALALTGVFAPLANAGIETTVAAFKELGQAMADGAISGKEFQDMLIGQLQAILDLLPSLFIQAGLQLIIDKQYGLGIGFLAAGLTSAFVGGLTEGLTSDSGSTTNNAHGNAFDSNIVPFKTGGAFTNSIVDTPTTFKFAKGTGLMGEAGAEAIVPLTRTASGDLGVKSTGGGNVVNINVINQNGSNVDVQQSEDENGNIDIEVLVQNAVNKGFNTGKFDGAITSRYDTKQKGVG